MIPAIAPVAELVDAPDSKSGDGNIVLVRNRPGAPSALLSHTQRNAAKSTFGAVAQDYLPKMREEGRTEKSVFKVMAFGISYKVPHAQACQRDQVR
jgi:hypothetical protein